MKALITGFGSIGRRHVKNLQALGVDDFVLYRTGKGTLEDDTQNYTSTSSLDEALGAKPQIAVISNPTSEHLPTAIAAAKLHCDLYIEKPLSHSLENLEELNQLSLEHRLVVMIGCQFRFHPLLRMMRSQVLDGRIGNVIAARAEWGEYLPQWHPWEDHRKSYSARADLGGGVILTLIHPLDYLYWMFGPVDNVKASIRSVPSLETPAGEDWADISLTFANGVSALVHLDYLQRPPVHSLQVFGDRGRALLDFHAGNLRWETTDGKISEERVPDGFERNAMFIESMRHFLDCVKSRKSTDIPLADGIEVLKIALAAQRAA